MSELNEMIEFHRDQIEKLKEFKRILGGRYAIDTDAPPGREIEETSEAKNIAMDIVQDVIDHVFWLNNAEEPEDYRKMEGYNAIAAADKIVEALIKAGWRPTEELDI